MPAPPPSTRTTVYPHNTRPGRPRGVAQAGWHDDIRRLVERDYAFLPLSYAADGYLFRGLDSGLTALLDHGWLERNRGDHALAALERECGVLFVSQDYSDALALARLHEDTGESAVLVIPAATFADAHSAGRAAVLGFADPGVVFRFPFFAAPLPLSSVHCIIVNAGSARLHAHTSAHNVALLAVDSGLDTQRASYDRACRRLLEQHALYAARAIGSSHVPRLCVAHD